MVLPIKSPRYRKRLLKNEKNEQFEWRKKVLDTLMKRYECRNDALPGGSSQRFFDTDEALAFVSRDTGNLLLTRYLSHDSVSFFFFLFICV